MAENEFEGEWTISTSINTYKIVTPTFAPFPGKNISFCFEAEYKTSYHNLNDVYRIFKLKLVKLSNAGISSTSKIVVDVKVKYSDGSLFTEYPSKSLYDGMNCVTFDDEARDVIVDGITTDHFTKLRSETLIIKCKMIILDNDQTSNITTAKKKSNKFDDVMRNLKSIYESNVLSDFVFKVGDKSLPAHKFILAAHSPVFKNMMTHEFLESKTNSVTITDASPEVFELFLRSLYGGELEDKTWDSLKEIYYLVDKYDVGFLKDQCSDTIISLLSVDLVCEILKLSYKFSDSDLKTAAINFAVNHIKEIVPRDDWKELVETHPKIGYEVSVNFFPK